MGLKDEIDKLEAAMRGEEVVVQSFWQRNKALIIDTAIGFAVGVIVGAIFF